MGRKSRRNDAAVPAIADKPLEIFPTAIYARLSVENSGKDDDGAAIATQIEICREYIKSCPHLQLVKVYQDNGFTGTTMARPAFAEMWEDIKSGLIKAVVVRDLSRYSRNYIETGTHLEKIFPKYDVRFISVKEDFDTFAVDGSAESLMIPLQSLINDFYSKDISRKVEAALHTQMEEGEFKWRQIPYGYKWNEDHTNIVPDEKTAPFVRDMFRWKLEGKSVLTISDLLDEAGAPLYQDGKFNSEKVWVHSSLFAMLKNPAYVGDRVYGVTHSAIYKGIKTKKQPKEEWYVIPDAHEAIVDRDTFYAVQQILKKAADKRAESMKRTEKDRAKLVDLFRGKVFCADCGKRLYYHKHVMECKNPYWYGDYECSSYVSKKRRTCSPHIIRQSVFNETVLQAIRMQVKTAMDYEVLLDKLKNTNAEKSVQDRLNNLIQSLQQRIRGLQVKRSKLYEDYAEGILDEEEYSFAKATYDNQYDVLNRQLDELIVHRTEYQDAMRADNKWITLMKSVRNCRKLTQELVDTVVEKVLVYEDRSLEVILRYQDIYEIMVKYTEEIQKKTRGLKVMSPTSPT